VKDSKDNFVLHDGACRGPDIQSCPDYVFDGFDTSDVNRGGVSLNIFSHKRNDKLGSVVPDGPF
jgi:hypothetical protein